MNGSLIITAILRFSAAYAPIHQPLTSTICMFGIVANLANVIVLTRPAFLGATNLLLSSFAFSQIGLLTSYQFFIVYRAVSGGICSATLKTVEWLRFALTVVNLDLVFHQIAIAHVCLLAIVRYFVVQRSQVDNK